jgi:hypothetical protein
MIESNLAGAIGSYVTATIDVSDDVREQLRISASEALSAPVANPRIGTAALSSAAPSWITLVLDHATRTC